MPRSKAQFKQIKDKRKAKLLSSCLYLFAKEGYEEVAVDDICKKAKCAHGLFYHYFDSTEAALKEALASNEEVSLFACNLEAVGKEGLKKLCKEISSLLKGKKDDQILMVKLCLNLHQQNSIYKSANIKAYSYYPHIKKLIKTAQAEGEVTQANLDQVCDLFIACLNGVIDSRLYLGVEEFKPISSDVLLSSVCK